MLRFNLDGHLLGTTSSAGAAAQAGDGGAGGGGQGSPSQGNAAAGASTAAAAASTEQGWSFPTEKAFAEYLPKEFAAEASLRDIKSFPDLVKGFVNAQKMVGLDKAKLVALPKDSNDNEGYANVYRLLGHPEKVDGYQIPKPAGGDYSAGDRAFQESVLPVLHEAGITQRQLEAIVPKWNAIQAAALEAKTRADQAAFADSQKALRTEFGAAYDAKVKNANDALAWFANDPNGPKLGAELEGWLKSTGPDGKTIGNSPVVAKLFDYLGSQMKEDGLIGKGGAAADGAHSPNEAQQEINALRADTKFMKAYSDKRDAGHADAVAKMEALYKQAYPTGTPA